MFWSGTEAGELRLPEHADYVASVLLDGPDKAGREWALSTLPVSALAACRQMRGFDTGRLAARIDAAIERRSGPFGCQSDKDSVVKLTNKQSC